MRLTAPRPEGRGLTSPLTTENFKFYYTPMYLSGVPVRVDPRPVGHAPPREEVTMRTDADGQRLGKVWYINFQLQLYRSAGLALKIAKEKGYPPGCNSIEVQVIF